MNLLKSFAVLLSGSMIAGLCAAQPADAAKDYPSRPIKLVVPYPPGGATDTLARKVGEDLRKRLNATVVVENRPGAGTILGTDQVAKAQPDGYAVLLNAPAGIEQLPWLQKLPYDPIKDLQPLSLAALVPVALIVPSSTPVNNFAEFKEYAKAHRGKMSFASLGNGSTAHIFGETLNGKLGAQAVHSPYKGDAPAMLDLVAGRVNFMFNNVASSINFKNRGSVKILAVTGTKRIPALPDVPTLAELGMDEFDLVGWFAFFLPAGTPKPIAEKLHAALREAYQTKEFSDYLAAAGLGGADISMDQFTKQVIDEHAKWGRLIKANNIKIE
jgi:tripartite-type tricarboxylate transporter receptor subunit TctC